MLRFVVVVLLGLTVRTQGQSLFKKPLVYIAGPDQLTLVEDSGGVRFGYQALNQFRAERRYPNGTVEGYYGYIGADGRPVRVKYTATDTEGFQATSEEIPLEFTDESPAPENIVEVGQQEKFPILNEVTSDDAESISVIAADIDPASENEALVRKTRSVAESHKVKNLRKQLKKHVRQDGASKKTPSVKKWLKKIHKTTKHMHN